ncbi:MAG: glycosyltransferase [Actinobacteria bacterium]|nr:glycosyltransferase [Actinomycetota bacterium]
MSATLLDVTDLVEFLQRRESVSGVQRVIAETAPLLIRGAEHPAVPVILDRPSGRFVALSVDETESMLNGTNSERSPNRDTTAAAATGALVRARTAAPINITPETVLVFLGAVWINDALMLAARDAGARGARLVFLLYDLTPVLETGHTAAVNMLFERYLELVIQTASAVPAISKASRDDFVRYCERVGRSAPPGEVTGLPCGIGPGQFDTASTPWPRPYALLVGTVEARKNHLLAFKGWQRLIERHGPDAVPDLVCIGRLGWHADDFLEQYVATQGLSGKVSLLSNSVSDVDLARFYAHAEFTVYPSRYEGWGLPVSESLAFGKVAITANNSSLPEAGGDLASYFTSDDVDDFVRVVEMEGLDVGARATREARIAAEFEDLTWQHVADCIAHDIARAHAQEARKPVFAEIELGREYVLATGGAAPDSGYADQYMRHLQSEGLTPMLRQPRGTRDFETVDAAVIGTFGSPQVWGNELRPGSRADFRINRPVDGPLVLLVSTRSMPGVVRIDAVGPGGPVHEEVYLGSVITLPLGSGAAGEPAQVSLTVTDAQDSVEGFLGIRSFVVLTADDLQSQVVALKSTADALRQELDFVLNTRSWKVTAPLRRLKGRGAS